MKIKTASISFIISLILLGITITSVSLLSLSRTIEVKEIWYEFERQSTRLNSLIVLRSELGYGGLIHHFKNYILRQKEGDAEHVITAIGGARLALKNYNTLQLSSTEERALLKLDHTILAYNNALKLVSELIKKNKTAKQIDNIVRIDDAPALTALKELEGETQRNKHNRIVSQPFLLNELRTTMGYGGLIHNYKNYILRSSLKTFNDASKDISKIKALINQYNQIEINRIEKSALQKIKTIVLSYEEKLYLIKKLINKEHSARNIDKLVVIDDVPALDGLNDLQKQIALRAELNADKLRQSLDVIQLSGQAIFYITLISFVLLVALSSWLLIYEVTQPISKLTSIMSLLSKNKLNVKVEGKERNTEIGDMARSVEIFKDNTIKKYEIEQELKNTNENLEEVVHERTKTLKENEAQLTSLIENAVDAIITINQYGVIQSFNAAAMAFFGYTAHEVIGQNVEILMSDSYKTEHNNYLSNYMKTGKKKIIGVGREVIAKRKNGTAFPIELAVHEIKSTDGVKLFTGIIRDITDKKAKEIKLQQSTKAAEKANQAKSEFLSSMSHELRTPMNAILGFGQLLERSNENLNEQQCKNVNEIITAGNHLLTIINDVLDLSKIESGKIEIDMEAVQVSDVLKQSIYLVSTLAKSRKIEILDQISKQNHLVHADFMRFKQVMINLLSNAIKYNSDHGSIMLQSKITKKHRLRISISDTGEGMDKNEINKLFISFERLNTVNNIEGTGIGLVISKQLIELMGGCIGVDSTPGKGSTFWFELALNEKA